VTVRSASDDRSRASLCASACPVLHYSAMSVSLRLGWWGAWKIKSAKKDALVR
jgi:hypothetical protein